MQAIHLSNIKYGQTSTPLSYQKEYSKPRSRKLWQKENICSSNYTNGLFQCTPILTETWDKIESPQYVNFFSAASESKPVDTYFDQVRHENVFKIQSPKVQKLPGTDGDDPLLTALHNCSLSKMGENNLTPIDNMFTNKEVKFTFAKVKNEKNNGEKYQGFTSTPFSFDWNNKHSPTCKQERIDKQVMYEEKKPSIFHANPVPKFIKRNMPTIFKRTVTDKSEEMKSYGLPTKLMRKEPFRPCLPTRTLVKARTPKLSTALRAQQRKKFDDRIKEKEKQLELAKQLEETATKKSQEKEIALLRRKTVHKAQPIRRYKALPEVQKRPLTDPISPSLSFKRRRQA